jgi:hypothetical protein
MIATATTITITTTITAALTLTTPAPLPTAELGPPNSVDVEHTDDSIHVLAYDPDGEVTAEIVEWWDGADIRIDANFPDGVYLSATVRGEDDVTIESNDPAAVSEHLVAVEDLLANTPAGANKWICAAEVLAAGAACAAAAGPVGVGVCALGALLVSCACIPLIDEKIPDDAECFE